MQFGSRINGRLVNLPATLGLTKPNEIYEVYVDTQGIPDETAAIQQLLTLEQNIQDLKVLYVETDVATGRIVLQFMDMGPGQFGLETILGWLPQILILSGIIVVGLFIFGLIPALQGLPGWLWYFVAIGGLLIVGAWFIRGWEPPTEISALAKEKVEERKRKTEIKRKEAEEIETREKEKAAIERTEKQVGVVRGLTEQLVTASDKVKDCEREKNREGAKAKPSRRKLEALDEQCQKLEEQAQNLAFRVTKETEILDRIGEKSVGVKASPAMIHELRQIIKEKKKAGQDTSKEEEMLAEQLG